MNTRTVAVFAATAFLFIGARADAQTVQNQLETAMSAAQDPAIQSIASHVFCYCGCDVEHGHRSLLDCYTQGHVPGCNTCQSEFVRIGQMNAQGQNVAQIQNTIDQQFSHAYPFPRKSAILRQYLAGKSRNYM